MSQHPACRLPPPYPRPTPSSWELVTTVNVTKEVHLLSRVTRNIHKNKQKRTIGHFFSGVCLIHVDRVSTHSPTRDNKTLRPETTGVRPRPWERGSGPSFGDRRDPVVEGGNSGRLPLVQRGCKDVFESLSLKVWSPSPYVGLGPDGSPVTPLPPPVW